MCKVIEAGGAMPKEEIEWGKSCGQRYTGG